MVQTDSAKTVDVGAPASQMRILAGARIGRFVVEASIGEGGMGCVYRAFDPQLQRHVALKLLRAADRNANARALREAQAMARLAHPHVIAVFDVGEHDGAIFFAMEMVDGMTLRDWIAEGPHPWREVLAKYRPAGEGLAAAHQAGLVHRDFKPANVLIGRDGRVQVTDFGLARGTAAISSDEVPVAGTTHPSTDPRLTQDGVVLGTPPYMAPEQSRGHDPDPRSDQYAFCVALYEALFGVRPFVADTRAQLEAAKRRGVPFPYPRASSGSESLRAEPAADVRPLSSASRGASIRLEATCPPRTGRSLLSCRRR